MASSGKKNKKTKKVSMTLEQFLKDVPQTPIRKSTDWADIVEDEADAFEPRPKQNIVLPTAPRAARVPVSNEANIPQDPPYVAYISNLTYDVDENDLEDFFRNLKITNIRLPREDREPGKLRGFGYVEFADRNNLIQAMTLSDSSLKGRRMRIEVSTNDEKKRMGGGMGGNRMDMQRDRPDRSETSGDWRSGPRQESSFQESAPIERRSGFNNRDTYEPPSSNKPGAWRDSNDRPPAFRDNRDNRDDRRGGGRDRDYGGGRRNYNDREEGFTRRNFSRDDDNRSESSEPRTRQKLILAPRKEPITAEPVPPPAAPAAPSIFGAAKPVDTSARERQIEERLARERELKAAEIKKEAELAKAKEETDKEISRPPVVENSWRTAREETNNQEPKKDSSPVRRRDSPRRDRDNSRRRDSPKRAGGASDSPQRSSRRDSPSSRRRGDSPSSRRRDSPLRRRDGSPRRRDGSPIRRRDSPQRRRDGPPPLRRNDDRRGDRGGRSDVPVRGSDRERDQRPSQRNNNISNKGRYDDKPHKERNNVETKERNVEDRMPKLKEQEAPNFAASNKFAFLETEDASD